MSTMDNLKEAFAGESQANRKYLAFSKKAEKDGLKQIAKLFRAAANAETVHAHAHFRVMGGVNSTTENVKSAIEGEGFEFQKMYPEFVKEAEQEGNKAALNSFKNAMEVEEIHHNLYSQALEAAENDKDLDSQPIYVCQVCGNTLLGEAEDKCSVCGAPKSAFEEVK
jgi:rubrerythrin